MGRGLSAKSQYGHVYRMLGKLRRKLAIAGVSSEYKAGYLRDKNDSFHVWYGRSNASNGECWLYPTIAIGPLGDAKLFGGAKFDGSYDAGIARIIELFAA